MGAGNRIGVFPVLFKFIDLVLCHGLDGLERLDGDLEGLDGTLDGALDGALDSALEVLDSAPEALEAFDGALEPLDGAL